MAVNNQFYNENANLWWDETGSLATLRFAVNPVRFGYFKQILEEKLNLECAGKKLLDVGSGGGYLSEEFARLGCRVTGIDPSVPSIEAARRHSIKEGLAIQYTEGNGENLPFGDQSFDIICCCDVLEHVDDLGRVMSEISRALVPGGLFFMIPLTERGEAIS